MTSDWSELMLTAAVALADLALYHKFPTTNYHMPACFVLSKAYTISFYAVSTICELCFARRILRTDDSNACVDIKFSYDVRPAAKSPK